MSIESISSSGNPSLQDGIDDVQKQNRMYGPAANFDARAGSMPRVDGSSNSIIEDACWI